MRAVSALFLLALLSHGLAQESTTADDNNINLNSLENKPPAKLDPYIRKALLKALSELEEHENFTSSDAADVTTDTQNQFTADGPTETTQPKTDGIKIHSFLVNGQGAFDVATTPTSSTTNQKISILSTRAGNVENHLTDTLPTKASFNEIFESKDSEVNYLQVRSLPSISKDGNNANSIDSNLSSPQTTKSVSTTTTTTTTTTPRPTHNNDGENIEEVNQRDVQVFQAPLVAAFTVHQDAQGLPKKVVPIFQQLNAQDLKQQTSPASNILPPVESTQTSTQQNFNTISNTPQSDFINQHFTLQKQLEEKQKYLEEQLRLLQNHQNQQEELLRRQQYLLLQKDAEKQALIEQQRAQVKNNLPNQISSQNNAVRVPNPQFTIQASIPIEHNVNNQQQLPNREAVDFLLHLRNQQSQQFPLQHNHVPSAITNFLLPAPAQNINPPSALSQNLIQPTQSFSQITQSFNQGNNINQIDPFRQSHGNRVFRQEIGVGNFGFNNQNFNRFNNFNQGNRGFPLNRQNTFSNPDFELKQLLIQNGLNGRSHEDLNIVSKVLSLNHGIPLNNNVSNRLNFDSRRNIRPF